MPERYSPTAWRLFDLAFRPWMRSRVHPVLVTGLPRDLPAGRAVVLCPNHTSWWDGFLLRRVHRQLRPDAAFLTVMLERELVKRPLFRRLGAVGLDPGDPSSLRRLLRRMARARREDPDVVVVFFPQGRMRPSTVRPLDFREGVRLLARALAPVTILPVGLHLAFGREARAVAYVSVGEPVEGEAWSGAAAGLEARVEGELDAILHFLETHGEDAARAWPGPLGRLPRAPEGPHFPEPGGLVWPGTN